MCMFSMQFINIWPSLIENKFCRSNLYFFGRRQKKNKECSKDFFQIFQCKLSCHVSSAGECWKCLFENSIGTLIYFCTSPTSCKPKCVMAFLELPFSVWHIYFRKEGRGGDVPWLALPTAQLMSHKMLSWALFLASWANLSVPCSESPRFQSY